MKKKITEMLKKKNEQRASLNAAMIEADTKEERSAIGETLTALGEEIRNLEEMLKDVDAPAEAPVEAPADARSLKPVAAMGVEARDSKPEDNAEARAKEFAKSGRMTIGNSEARAVLVSSGSLATPTEVAGINGLIGKQVSSIIDLVKVVNAEGMGAYKVAYMVDNATAAKQTEGEAYNNSESTFDYVEIKPQTEAILSYVSKQVQKQTPLDYKGKVNESALLALRKRAAAVVTAQIVASGLNTTLAETAIGAGTLRKIAFNYGGNESVVGAATLFLNKTDLIAFGDVRGSNEKKAVYEITPDATNPNTGIIKDGGLSVPYCIDSNLTAGTMIYGQAQNFELALFSNYEIRVSEDFAFDKGLLAIRGDVELGGDVVVKDGFVKVTIGG